MRQYEMFELQFQGEEPAGSQAVVDVTAEFSHTGADGKQTVKTVKGFYAGNGVYKVRFYPSEAGAYTWKVKGLVSGEGSEECAPSGGSAKGIVKAVGTHFEYENGEVFKPFGTTIYAMNHQDEELRQTTFATLKTAPFNKVRHCVFPKHYDYNHNEPPYYAFEKDADGNWDVNRPCFAFWDHFEEGIFALADMGIQSDLILFHPYDNWGFATLSMEDNLVYLDYLLRRFSAIPEMWWSMANEYDLCAAKTMEDWYAIEDFIVANDPYGHLLSNHNCFGFYDFKRPHITHQCVQTILVEKSGEWQKEIGKPLVYDECCYEGNLPLTWGNISGFEMVNRFWKAVASGAYATHGEVFLSDDEVLWWAKGGALKGQSPKRIAFLREIVGELPGPIEYMEEDKTWMLSDEYRDMIANHPEELAQSPMVQAFLHQTEYDRLVGQLKDQNYCGHVGEEAYIIYYGTHCNGIGHMTLPEDKKYRIEVIDAWEMTRETAAENVSGEVEVKLPGKVGTAILATRM